MRLIYADELKKELRHIYELGGWEPKEVHFSLLDMESNIDNIKSALVLDIEPIKAPLPELCDQDIVSWKAFDKAMNEAITERKDE